MTSDVHPEDITGLDEERLLAVLSYIAVLVVVPLVVGRGKPFVMFHARQGLILWLAIILSLVIVAWSAPLGSLLFLVLMILDIVALVQTILGRTWQIPGIGTLAGKVKL